MIKKKNHKILIYLLITIIALSCKNNEAKKKDSDDNKDSINYKVFLDPTNEYRSFPFYSINDSLSEDEIKWQIHDFKQAGFGGFYLHSRLGLITEYLGDDWWKIMNAAVKEAQASDLQAMFYDEDKWPSGYAGGIIPRMSENYRAKCLVRLDKKTPLPIGSEIIKEDEQYIYIIYTTQFGYDIFNGTCYVDLFNPEVVQKFIEVSYQPYVDKYLPLINNYTFSIFSDEPHIAARYFDKKTPHLGILSYSPWLEKKFEAMYGYSLRDKLALLFEEKENWREVRMHYYRAKALQFEESFTKQISDYAAKSGFNYTGHYLGEEVIYKVRDRIGNSMLHYRNMQQPGMDQLGLNLDNKTITAKNLSSVANQYGKKKRLSELFGISGQNMNFEDRKWIAGWHSILGINHFCPHLTLYSMKGARKRDYPPTFSYQQPYWQYNKKIEDYLGRISYATSIGTYNPQILVIYPLESAYIKDSEDGQFTTGINDVLEVLQDAHYDYDMGDEQILADTAFVNGSYLTVGAMHYQHVILPDMISIRQSTIDLLIELHNYGGYIFNTGRFPKYVDGVENKEEISKLEMLVVKTITNNLENALLRKIQPNVIIKGQESEKIWSQTRLTKGGKLIQLFNSSHTKAISFELQATLEDQNVVLWDPSLAQCFILEANTKGFFDLEIAPSSNIWITTGTLSNQAVIQGNYQKSKNREKEITLDKKWKGKRLQPNAITLDFAAYSTDHGKSYKTAEPVIAIFNRLSKAKYFGNLLLRYQVAIKDIPDFCQLVLEQPKMYSSIKINNKHFPFKTDGFYVDHTFKTTTITKLLKSGNNTIQLELDFEPIVAEAKDPAKRYGTEIESIYLIGNFGVTGKSVATYETQKNKTGNFPLRPVHQFTSYTITAEKETFDGNLVLEGYPFYAGTFTLSQKFAIQQIKENQHYFVELPNCESIVAIVKLNGQSIDSLVWAPFKTEITPFLKEGENELEITLVNSLRNLLGPHHHKGGEMEKVGPKSFTGSGGFPDGKGDSNWFDLRIAKTPTKIWTDLYNHIPFGFIDQVQITIN